MEVLISVCVGDLCLSLSWWHVFISVMMVAGCVSFSVMVAVVDLCVGGLFMCGCLSPSVMMTAIVVHVGGLCISPSWCYVFISVMTVGVYLHL